MSAYEIIFLCAFILYFLQTFIFTLGASKKFPRLSESELPFITILVAARNEEDNILDCMKSLDNLEYPAGKIEIILIDDHSTDKTNAIINDFIKDKPKFKCISAPESVGRLKGKANALAYALKFAKGKVILTTDADCVVSPLWAKTLASYYADNVAFVGGYTTQDDKTIFGGMQAVDFIYLLTVSAGSMNFNRPNSCIGNNMSYLKKAYDEVGGYESIPFSVTEDFSLLKAIHNLGKYKVIYPCDPGSLVTSKPCKDWKSLYWQKKRWGVGGIKNDYLGYLAVFTGYVTHLSIVLMPFIFSAVSLYLTFSKVALDYFFVKTVFNKLGMKLKIVQFFAFEIYFIIYVLVLPFVVLPSRKVMWKGRVY
ncbi:glycosyltransferase [Melioribacteraceae bacterium 4301-Me]|uniref:glycosyltransferase n=1 Tax=Pyranulibacter aquaticus TaxID=3163344 RepID=UPI003598A4B4